MLNHEGNNDHQKIINYYHISQTNSTFSNISNKVDYDITEQFYIIKTKDNKPTVEIKKSNLISQKDEHINFMNANLIPLSIIVRVNKASNYIYSIITNIISNLYNKYNVIYIYLIGYDRGNYSNITVCFV